MTIKIGDKTLEHYYKVLLKQVKEIFSKNNNRIQLLMAESCLQDHKIDKTILFIGVFHGDEPEGKYLIEKLSKEIEDRPQIIGNNRILFIPVLNPDGKAKNTRVNANGVDLNRNFPTANWRLSAKKKFCLIKNKYYSGPKPASEIETQFLVEIIEEYKPDIIITLHTPYKVVNYDGPAKELAEKISQLTGYPVQENIGYPTPGSFGTYAGIERNIKVITLELPENTELEQLWNETRGALLYVIGS